MSAARFSVHQASALPADCGEAAAIATGTPLGNLLSALSRDTAVLATRKSLQKLTVQWTDDAVPYDASEGTAYSNPFRDVKLDSIEGRPEHKHDIVTVSTAHSSSAAGGVLLGTIDSRGHIIVGGLESGSSVSTASPPHLHHGQYGWAGLAFQPGDATQMVSALQFQQTIVTYKEESLVRTLHTAHPVTSVGYLSTGAVNSHSPLIAATEHNQISIWDARAAERGGCVRRLMPCPGALLCLDSNERFIAASGVDRVVYYHDPRKWVTVGAWKSALKLEVSKLFLSSNDERVSYAFGKVDGEFACGSFVKGEGGGEGRLGKNNFRGDSRWVGVSKMHGSDDFIGVTAAGTLYGIRDAFSLAPAMAPPEARKTKGSGGAKRPRAEGEGADTAATAATEETTAGPVTKRARQEEAGADQS